jgi:hypothetical protein
MTFKIFLSHSSSDKDLVNMIADNAKMIGIDVYLYEHDFHPEMPVANKLKDAIKKSDAMVVLLTKNSESSPYVQQEIGVAEGYEKLIIPLVETDVNQQNLAMLTGKEYISLDVNNLQESLPKLSTYLKQLKEGKEAIELVVAIIIIALLDRILKLKNKNSLPKTKKKFLNKRPFFKI